LGGGDAAIAVIWILAVLLKKGIFRLKFIQAKHLNVNLPATLPLNLYPANWAVKHEMLYRFSI
jgi:hypothetical protein